MPKRGRKRKAPEEESDDTDYILPSPLKGNTSRPAVGRVTRRSSLINNQCASSTTPIKSYPLRSLRSASNPRPTGARRNLREANDESSPESSDLQTQTLEPLDENKFRNLRSASNPRSTGARRIVLEDNDDESPGTQTHTPEPPHENELRSLRSVSNPRPTGARRIMLEANDESSPQSPDLQTHTSELPHENELPNSPFISAHFNPHAQQEESIQKFTSAVLSQTEVPPGFHPIIPQSKSAGGVPENTATGHTDNNIQLNRCTSLNMTEIAMMCNDNSLEGEEIESSCNPALVRIGRYRIKPEMAPLLREIFAKYGDIAQDSVLKSVESSSHFLETVCHICQDMKKTNFTEVTPVEVDKMLHQIDDLEMMKLNVGWLRAKLYEVKEVKKLLRDYPTFKQEKAEIESKEKDLKSYKADLASVQRAVLLLEDELTALKTKNERTFGKFQKMNDKIRAYIRDKKSLLDGLL